MKFLIVSHAFHYQNGHQLKSYAPFVREINLWIKGVDKVEIIAPKKDNCDENITLAYTHNNIQLLKVPALSLIGFNEKISALLKVPSILKVLFIKMKSSDHIHLRCPGNMGLLGCLVQILFPKTPKTAKYAGNWDPDSEQPWSYNLQKRILKNTFLTKNMKVLVYGNWPNQTKNIKPFFTASYYKSEIEPLYIRNYTKTLHFCFVGSLSQGKQPGLAIDFIDRLKSQGIDTVLHIYGDGDLKASLQNTLKERNLEDHVFMYGNQPKKQIKKALKYSHFLILPSKSEGWPKAVAEAMFWGCIPIVSPVSCVPWMLDFGKRGFLLQSSNIEENCKRFKNLLHQQQALEEMSREGSEWSREFTLDKFQDSIAELL